METSIVNTKPSSIRTLLIMNGIKAVLPLGFYIAAKNGLLKGLLEPNLALLTLGMWLVMYALLVFSINRRNMLYTRIVILLDFVAWIPAKAMLGILFGLISLGITFTKSAKQYFSS